MTAAFPPVYFDVCRSPLIALEGAARVSAIVVSHPAAVALTVRHDRRLASRVLTIRRALQPARQVTGDERTIRRLARKYRIAYQIEKPKPGDDTDVYNVTHSQGVYIFDNQGEVRLLASDSEDTAAFTEDLRKLIQITS